MFSPNTEKNMESQYNEYNADENTVYEKGMGWGPRSSDLQRQRGMLGRALESESEALHLNPSSAVF